MDKLRNWNELCFKQKTNRCFNSLSVETQSLIKMNCNKQPGWLPCLLISHSKVWDVHVEADLMKNMSFYSNIVRSFIKQRWKISETPFSFLRHFHPHLFTCFACSFLISLRHLRFPLTKWVLTSKMKWPGIRKCTLHYLQCKRWSVLLKTPFQRA